MASPKRIPIPWNARVQHWCHRVLPVVGFLFCLGLTVWMWRWQTATPQLVGEVEAVRVDVVSGTEGRLTALAHGNWTLFDRVESGTVIARLDDRPIQAEMETLRAELARLRYELAASEETITIDESTRDYDRQRERLRLAWQALMLRLDTLDRTVVLEADRIESSRLAKQLSFFEPLLDRGASTEMEVTDLRLQRDVILKRIGENEQALTEVERQVEWNLKRLREYADLHKADTSRLLAPMEAAVVVQERRMDQLRVQIEGLEVHAPISGTIAAIHAWPGQNVATGQPIVTIATEQGRYIVSYVRQDQRLRPQVGMSVALRTRGTIIKPIPATVERVGPQVEPIPPHQCRASSIPEWGFPIRITMPNDFQARPGELVDIIVRNSSGDEAG